MLQFWHWGKLKWSKSFSCFKNDHRAIDEKHSGWSGSSEADNNFRKIQTFVLED